MENKQKTAKSPNAKNKGKAEAHQAGAKLGKREKAEVYALFVVEVAVLTACYYAYQLGAVFQWLIAIVSLVLVGIGIKKIGRLQGWSFVYLLSSKKGLKNIDDISKKYKSFWNEMALWGIVLSFGLLSYPFIKGRMSKKTYAFGMLSLIVILFFVLPYLSVALPFINIPQFQNAVSSAGSASQSINYVGIAFDAVSIVGGFAGYIFAALLYNTFLIINGAAVYFASLVVGNPQISAVTSQLPGVAPIIPGIDIPLFAGVISLAILLIVHEFSHGILAREAKVKLKSIGLLIVGIIPMGAFVEPDEKGVEKLEAIKQTKIFSAGISANFIAMLVFFALMILVFYLVLPKITSSGVFVSGTIKGYPAYNAIAPGTQVFSWNNKSISTIAQLENASQNDTVGSKVDIGTSNGTFVFTAIQQINSTSKRGLVGVNMYQKESVASGAGAQAWYFLFTLFALSFMLNFLVGVVNLLPIPGFDGWRIYKTNIKSAKIVNLLAALVLIMILVNALQWLAYA